MLNKQSLIGNLGNDPETITFENGNKITKFSIATSKSWKDKNSGEKKTETQWHNIICQSHFADSAGKYLKKGSKVYLEGETRHRHYETSGVVKYITEVYISEMKFLSPSEKTAEFR